MCVWSPGVKMNNSFIIYLLFRGESCKGSFIKDNDFVSSHIYIFVSGVWIDVTCSFVYKIYKFFNNKYLKWIKFYDHN